MVPPFCFFLLVYLSRWIAKSTSKKKEGQTFSFLSIDPITVFGKTLRFFIQSAFGKSVRKSCRSYAYTRSRPGRLDANSR